MTNKPDQTLADEPTGYGRPPRSSRFRPGQSGNPRGRPRNRSRELPYNAVLGQLVTVREEGRERRVTGAEAFLLHLTQKGLAGDSAAARASLAAIENARAKHTSNEDELLVVTISFVGLGIETILQPLGIATKKHANNKARVRWELEPWIVEAALARLGARRLTVEEQGEVWRNTRTPHRVSWPEWWIMRG